MMHSDGRRNTASRMALGRHVTVEYCGCNPKVIDDTSEVEAAFLDAARHSGATVLNCSFHRFEPQGVSGFVIISESHFSIHAWPEYNYAAVDIFTCGEGVSPEKAIARLKELLGAKDAYISSDMCRGSVFKSVSDCPGFSSGGKRDARDFAENWKEVFENSGAYGMSCSMDIGGCPASMKGRMDSCMSGILEFMGVESASGGDGVSKSSFGDSSMQCLSCDTSEASVSARFDLNAGLACIEIFSRSYFDSRDCAEIAVKSLRARSYKLHLALRM